MCVRGDEVYNSEGSYKPRFDLAAFFSLSVATSPREQVCIVGSNFQGGGGFGPYKWRHPGMLASKRASGLNTTFRYIPVGSGVVPRRADLPVLPEGRPEVRQPHLRDAVVTAHS